MQLQRFTFYVGFSATEKWGRVFLLAFGCCSFLQCDVFVTLVQPTDLQAVQQAGGTRKGLMGFSSNI